ncbi:D-alanyl-D-alanine carboxypeptidase/D-alanyl-D-alanine-endopeptidase [Puteibacter caeruleilacunae]|nr:D-alanyl-D-alanine carboxypeptidase/D-alanyl-D-alanine-endopeptidase [Puteibacter caeruleilacunae]
MTILFKLYTLFLFVLISSGLNAQNKLIDALNDFVLDPELKNASINCCVWDVESSEIILETEPQISVVPASVLKTITTATALELLGPDYTFKTTLSYSGELNKKTGVLTGDLLIKGGGDASLGSEHFEEHYNDLDQKWIDAIKEAGIKKIEGKILYDASIYDEQQIPRTWIWEDMGNYYGAGALGLNIFDNMYRIYFNSPKVPGKPTQIVKIDPEIPGLELDNQVKSAPGNRDNAYVFGSPYDMSRVVRGTIPANRKSFSVKASIPNPPLFVAQYLRKLLLDEGIRIEGEVGRNNASSNNNYTSLCTIESPTLKEIIRETNVESINLFAEQLLKHIGLQLNGEGSTKSGVKAVMNFWEEKGIQCDGMFLVDGSGLSRFNAITARQLVDIIGYMCVQSPNSREYINSLPEAGVNGTMKYYFKDRLPHDGRIKTGSMTRVRSMAGLVGPKGNRKVFAIMVNNYSCSGSELKKKMEHLVLMINDY